MIDEQISNLEILFNNYHTKSMGATAVDLSTLDGLKDAFKNAFESVFKSSSSPVRGLYESLNDKLRNKIAEMSNSVTKSLASVKGSLSDRLSNIKNGIKETSTTVWKNITSGLRKTSNAISDRIIGMKDKLVDSLTDTKDKIANGFKSALTSLKNKLGEVFTNLTTSLKKTGYKIADKFRDGLTSLKKGISDISNDMRKESDKIGAKIRKYLDSVKRSASNKYKELKTDVSKFAKNFRFEANRFIISATKKIRGYFDDAKKWFDSIFETARKEISDFINEKILEPLTNVMKFGKGLNDIFENLGDGKYSNIDDLSDDIASLFGVEESGGFLSNLLIAPARYGALIQAQIAPQMRALDASLRYSQAIDPTPPDALIRSLFLGDISRDKFVDEMRHNGLNADRANLVANSAKNIVGPGEAQVAFLRGIISGEKHDEILRKNGFNDEAISLFRQLYTILPPVQDIIRFAVREVFNPEIAESFGQFEDFPEEFANFARQAGLSDDWAKAYWAAHWDLPSPNMGYEMLHRGIVDEGELKLLLKALDIMPFWRDKLIQLSYNPLTRVDVRRMYGLGVISEDEVTRSYLDLGYSPENARRMTEFTVKYENAASSDENDTIRGLTRGVYTSAYSRGIISRDEFADYLSDLGYLDDDVEMLIFIADYDIEMRDKPVRKSQYYDRLNDVILKGYARDLYSREEAVDMLINSNFDEGEANIELDFIDYEYEESKKNTLVNHAKELYVSYTIGNSELHEFLNSFGLTANEISSVESELNLARMLRSRKPTLTDFRKFLNDGIISVDQFVTELRGLGYNEKYVLMYTKLYT